MQRDEFLDEGCSVRNAWAFHHFICRKDFFLRVMAFFPTDIMLVELLLVVVLDCAHV